MPSSKPDFNMEVSPKGTTPKNRQVGEYFEKDTIFSPMQTTSQDSEVKKYRNKYELTPESMGVGQ
eukprot:4953348-Ditylum_brightwellii.AAC.1